MSSKNGLAFWVKAPPTCTCVDVGASMWDCPHPAELIRKCSCGATFGLCMLHGGSPAGHKMLKAQYEEHRAECTDDTKPFDPFKAYGLP